jgi:hypothetical protein
MPSSLVPREVCHSRSHLGWHRSRTRSRVDPRAHASRPLLPHHHAHLRGVVIAHVPPRSVVAPPQLLPRHRRAHLKKSLPRAPQGDATVLVPPEIRRCHIAVVRTSWACRRVRALGIRCRNRSHLAVVRVLGGHHRVLASGIRRREHVPRIHRRERVP